MAFSFYLLVVFNEWNLKIQVLRREIHRVRSYAYVKAFLAYLTSYFDAKLTLPRIQYFAGRQLDSIRWV